MNSYPIQIAKRMKFQIIFSLFWVILLSVVFYLIYTYFEETNMDMLFLGIIGGVIVLFSWTIIYVWLSLKSISFTLDNDNLVIRGGIISRYEKNIPYSRVQHVILYQGFWQRMLKIASISIDTARENSLGSGQDPKVAAIGPIIPDLDENDAENLKKYLLSIINKQKNIAGV